MRALRRVAIARATLACAQAGSGEAVFLLGSGPAQRRIGAVCSRVPWSIGPGIFEVVLFERAVRVVGRASLPAGRSCALCGLCGLRLGEGSLTGHPLESLDGMGVLDWRRS